MLIFEITKTNTPLPQKGLAPILIAPPTYVAYAIQAMISSVKQSKTNVTPCLAIPDASGAPKYYRSHYNQWCCLHWMLRGSTWQIPGRKLLPRSIYDVLTQILNDFQWSLYRVQCRQTLAVAARHIRCRHGVTHLLRRNKATSASDCRPSAPWVLSSAGKLIRCLHGSYFLPYRSADVFLFCFLSAISIFLSLGSANVHPVHWTLSPPHHE